MADQPSIITSNPRFQMPQGFAFHNFTADTGEAIRYGILQTPNHKGVFILLPGLYEYIEKYYETMHDLKDKGYSIAIMDWPSQGESNRYLKDRDRRYSKGFAHELKIFHQFFSENVAQHFDVITPKYMLGHSMGGHMSLCYLTDYDDHSFKKVILSAPMMDIKIEPALLKTLAPHIANFFHTIGLGSMPVFGGMPWKPEDYDYTKTSHDPIRGHIMKAWFEEKPTLVSWTATFNWLFYALKSCIHLYVSPVLERVKTPLLIVTAGDDAFVDNTHNDTIFKRLQNLETLHIAKARHELLMEDDAIRNQFMNALFDFID